MKHRPDVPFRAFWPFLALTFGISWGVLGLYLFWPETATLRLGPLSGEHPLFYLAVYAPAISGLTLVGGETGLRGLRIYLSGLGKWRLSPGWTLFLLLGTPIPFFLGAALEGRLDGESLRPERLWSLFAAMGLMLIKGPVEEIGWRGFVLPLLQRRLRPLTASLVLGGLWGLWHYPAFLLGGTPQSAWNFTAFFLGTLALSVVVTALYNRSGGSLLVPVLFHFQMINPLWPDGQPADTIFFVSMAVLVCGIYWPGMWERNQAVTAVIPELKKEMVHYERDV
ncbi:type II CAAX endopeptidase family protein [Kiritimatiellaeota bacterium B1221]|nr:type II CAAX endopeptidase family protein [Kiritimatiellaeota bacterium B1221]